MINEKPELTFTSVNQIKKAHRELQVNNREMTESPVLVDDINRFIGAVVLAGKQLYVQEDRNYAQALLDYWVSMLVRKNHDPDDAILADFDEQASPDLSKMECPYKGLLPFNETDGQALYGRSQVIDDMLKQLEDGKPVLFVVGPNGAGASSLINAGLIPAVKKRCAMKEGAGCYVFPTIRPGSDPLGAFISSFESTSNNISIPAKFREKLLADPKLPVKLLKQSEIQNGIFIIDDFEKSFISCENQAWRKAFFKILKFLVEEECARVVLSIHSKFEQYVSSYKTLDRWYNSYRFRIPPMSARELKEVILGPARQVGLRFEDKVVDSLINDTLGEPSALSLLQFSLHQLWDNLSGSLVTWENYKKVGGGRVALRRSAEEFYRELNSHEKDLCKQLFLKLIQIGGDQLAGEEQNQKRTTGLIVLTTRRVERSRLIGKSAEEGDCDALIAKLVGARLLKESPSDASGSIEYEIVNEALIQAWPVLGQWLDEEREKLRVRQRLDNKAWEWVRLGRGKHGLLSEKELLEAEEWLKNQSVLNPNLQSLVQESRWTFIKERRIKNIGIGVLAVLLVIPVALYFYKNNKISEAKRMFLETETRLAKEQTKIITDVANAWQHVADRAMNDQQVPINLMRDSITAIDQKREGAFVRQKINNALNDTLERRKRLEGVIERLRDSKPGDAIYVQTLEDFGPRSEVYPDALPNVASSGVPSISVKHILKTDGSELWGVAVNQRLAQVAFIQGRLAEVWGFDGEQQFSLTVVPEKYLAAAVAFHPKLNILATAGDDAVVRLFESHNERDTDLTDGVCQLRMGGEKAAELDKIYDLAFSSGMGEFLIAGFDSDRAVVWRLQEACPQLFGDTKANQSKEPYAILRHTEPVYGVAVNPVNSSQLATTSGDKNVRIWTAPFESKNFESRIAGVVEGETRNGHEDVVVSADFSPDGKWLLTSSMDGTARIWSTEDGQQVNVLEGHTNGLGKSRFSLPNGDWVATASIDGTIRLWDRKTSDQIAVISEHQGPVFGLEFSSNGNLLISSSFDGTAIIWDVTP